MMKRALDCWGKVVIVAAIAATFALTGSGEAWGADAAKGYPSRPIRLIAQFPPGSATDIGARIVGQKLTDALGQQVVVDVRPGAGGRIGTELGAKAAPDGYTLTMSVAGPMSVAPALYPRLGYNVLRDFAPIANLVTQAQVLVMNLGVPVKSMTDFVEYARARPGSLSYASTGPGALTQLAMELVQSVAKVKLNHVPYKVTAVAHGDLMTGQVQMMVDSLPSALGLMKTGKVRGIAVTSRDRQKLAPELPTVAESGYPGFEVIGWLGVMAPAKTPGPILDRLTTEVARIADGADIQERFQTLGFTTRVLRRERYAEFIRAETSKWVKVVKDANVQVEE